MKECNEDYEPEELKVLAEKAIVNSLPQKSRILQETAYKDFCIWKKEKAEEWSSKMPSPNSEPVILAYFQELSERYKPSSLWSKYSMVRAKLLFNENVNIKKYAKVLAFLKQKSRGLKKCEIESVLPVPATNIFVNNLQWSFLSTTNLFVTKSAD